MKKTVFLWLCCTVSVLSAAVITPNVKLEVSGKKLYLHNLMQPRSWHKAQLRPFMYDGKMKKYIPADVTVSDSDGAVTLHWETGQWQYTTRFSAKKMLIIGESVLVNKSGKELFLEPGFIAKADFSEAPELFWDGFGKMRTIGKEPLVRNGIKGKLMKHIASSAIPFAGSAVMTGKSGIHLGHVMFDPVSYSASGYDPVKGELRFSQRVAVHPGETLQLRWVAGAMDASYGGAEAAVQQHYDAFPELWTVSGGQQNPYVWGNHAHYRTWWITPVPEEVRRYRISCEWTYTPYKRSGDMLCRPEQWDYRPNNPFRKKTPRFGGYMLAYPGMSREEFLQLRKERYLKYGKKYGWLFYNSCSGTWCEIQLAKSKYPDSLTDDTSSPTLLKSWSTGHDWEVRVFPMGTSFAADFRADMKKLTEELDLPGFALDCGSGGVYYRGPAVKKHLPGRAWDDEGVFIDQSVAINDEVDYIHSLRPGSMSVFINGPLKGDLVMYEESLVELAKLRNLMPLAKWHAGPRPTVSHGHGWEYRNMVPDWRSKTSEEFCDIIGKMSDHMIFSQFQLGINTTYISMSGNPQQIYILPEYEELKRAGWNSLVPLKLADTLYAPYRGCFGSGQNSFFFLGNSRPAECSGEVVLDNELQSRRKNTALLVVRKLRSKAETVNRINGRYTAFDAVLPSRVPVLFETVCAVEGAEKLCAAVSTEKRLDRQSWSVELSDCKPFAARVFPRDIRGFTLTGLELNGKKLLPGATVTLKSGDKLVGNYISDTFRITRDALHKFPFTNADGRISCRLHVPAGDQGAKAGAQRFNEFFRYLKKQKFLPDVTPAPVTSNQSSLQRADVIAFATGADENTISALPGGGIMLKARNADELEKLTCILLDEMDKLYPYVIPFGPVMGLNREMIYSAKMQGKHLPQRPYFE